MQEDVLASRVRPWRCSPASPFLLSGNVGALLPAMRTFSEAVGADKALAPRVGDKELMPPKYDNAASMCQSTSTSRIENLRRALLAPAFYPLYHQRLLLLISRAEPCRARLRNLQPLMPRLQPATKKMTRVMLWALPKSLWALPEMLRALPRRTLQVCYICHVSRSTTFNLLISIVPQGNAHNNYGSAHNITR